MRKLTMLTMVICMTAGILTACQGKTAAPSSAAPASGESVKAEEGKSEAAASGQAGTQAADAGESKKETKAADNLVVATVVKAIGSNWFDSMDWEGTKWAEENHAKHHYIGPTSMDSAAQLQCISDAIALRPDILTVVPIAADACDALLKQAQEQGTLVVTHEGTGLVNNNYNVDAFSNEDFGINFANKAAELIGEDCKYACMVGTLTTPAHMAWAKAFYEYANENYPNMVCLNDKNGDAVMPLEGGANADTAYSVAKQFLQANPNLQVFYVGSSSNVSGVCRAIEELGLGDSVKVLAVGTASGQKSYYESGTIVYGAFWYPGAAQYACYEAGKRVLAGETVKTGDDLGVEGYHEITVDGKNIYGSAWLDVTLENLDAMCEIL